MRSKKSSFVYYSFLQKGFKLQAIAIQQDQFLRVKYICDVSLFCSHIFVYEDETGADKRKYGKPVRNHLLLPVYQ